MSHTAALSAAPIPEHPTSMMDLDASHKYLFLFAHPDDDTFIAGTMWLLLQAGAEIHAVWFTSGGLLEDSELREQELRAAMGVLGLSEQYRNLCRFPDLGLVAALDQVLDKAAGLMESIKPDIIFATAYEGGHPDHDAVNYVAIEGARRAGLNPTVFEFPLYNGTGPVRHWRWRLCAFPPGGPLVRYNRLTQEATECKHTMMRTYASQWMYMIPARLASDADWMTRIGEAYRSVPAERDYLEPPHAGKLNYERWFNRFMKLRFGDFREAVRRTITHTCR